MNALILYLFQVAICHTVFYLLYRLLYSNLPHFNFSRIYLVSATVISFIIPLLTIGVWQPSEDSLGLSLFFSQGGVTPVRSETTGLAASPYDVVDLLSPAVLRFTSLDVLLYHTNSAQSVENPHAYKK